jgi:dCTP deaminase
MTPVQSPTLVMPPRSIALARSKEYWRIPPNVICVVIVKSGYARCSLVANVTPLEPGWEGEITIELSNLAPYSVVVRADEGIVQALFFEGDELAETGYTQGGGRYQGQRGITLPR